MTNDQIPMTNADHIERWSLVLGNWSFPNTMLPRILEPELMDTAADAREYDAMDHAAVNEAFVTDLLEATKKFSGTDWSLQTSASSVEPRPVILDLGAGTALIPIELCRRVPNIRVIAVDAAAHMLVLARKNIDAASLADHIESVRADAKQLPFESAAFSAVISNSILHHIADPRLVIAEAVRVTAPGRLLFHRDLCRPNVQSEVDRMVTAYAGDATPYQQKLLADSLRAALTLDEIRALVIEFGFGPETVQMNSDRHWTWIARRA
jgi:ubiquinone/menaquinone biosynthesis C-methylase UbiE